MASPNDGLTAGDETSDGAGGDATKRDVVTDGGNDAAVDHGLVVTHEEESKKPISDESDNHESTNHTGLTLNSIPID